MNKRFWSIIASVALPLGVVKQYFKKSKYVIIQVSIVLISTLLLAEVSFRVYHYFNPTFIFCGNSYNRYRGKAFAYDYYNFKLNSKGFKSKEFTEKKKDIYRIIGIGDSFTFGVVPYKYNYLTLLETQLQKGHHEVEVYNLGVPSIGPKEYLSLLVNEGLALQPNMLLLTFYVGNDFADCGKNKKLYEFSYIVTFVHYLITLETKCENGNINGEGEYYNDNPTIKEDVYLKIMKNRSFMYLKENQEFISLNYKAINYISIINDICKIKNIKLIVVIAPDEFQINNNLQKEIIKTYYPKLKAENWDITLPNKMLTMGLQKIGIKYIDLYPYFKKEAGARLYKPRDTHWNIAGNQLSANIIQEHVLEYIKELNAKQ